MALPEFTLRQLLEAGVHFGHQTQRWNPRMGEFIYGERNGIHIFDLTQTVPMLDAALNVIRETVAKNGRILFVGGGFEQLVVQFVIALVAVIFTAVMTLIIAFIVKPLGWRVSKEDEDTGIDETEHAETAYELA